MDCGQFEDRVSAFLEGELTEEETRDFLQHALRCVPCARVLEGVRRVRAALQQLAAHGPPAGYQLRVAAAVQQPADMVSPWLRPLAIAATAVLAAAILLFPQVGRLSTYSTATHSSSIWARQAQAWVDGDKTRPRSVRRASTYHLSTSKPHYSQARPVGLSY